jgi:DNA processing protein
MLGIGRGGPLGHAATAAPPVGRAAAIDGRADVGAPGGAPAPPLVRPSPRPLAEREAWIALAAVDGIGPVTFGVLVRAYGTARGVLDAASRRGGTGRVVAACAADGLRVAPEVAARIAAARDDAPTLVARLAALELDAVTAEDERYPRRLAAIELPPPVLFIAGDPLACAPERAVAVVGTRRPTDDGRRAAARLAGALAASGATVISGLAVGIDGSAHAGALHAEGVTVAVLGSGHARLYPTVHRDLAREIVRSGGAIVSELPPDAAPQPAGFPRRNRIISALADATVVVEAGERSGALVTASWALEQGRAVFAVPGPIERPQSVGCNRLLREHPGDVRIVAGAEELLEDLGYGTPIAVRARRRARSEATHPDPGAVMARLGPAESAVVRRLLDGPATADVLADAAGLAGATILAVLTRLEEEGLVAGAFGRYRLAGLLAGARAGRGDPAAARAAP